MHLKNGGQVGLQWKPGLGVELKGRGGKAALARIAKELTSTRHLFPTLCSAPPSCHPNEQPGPMARAPPAL